MDSAIYQDCPLADDGKPSRPAQRRWSSNYRCIYCGSKGRHANATACFSEKELEKYGLSEWQLENAGMHQLKRESRDGEVGGTIRVKVPRTNQGHKRVPEWAKNFVLMDIAAIHLFNRRDEHGKPNIYGFNPGEADPTEPRYHKFGIFLEEVKFKWYSDGTGKRPALLRDVSDDKIRKDLQRAREAMKERDYKLNDLRLARWKEHVEFCLGGNVHVTENGEYNFDFDAREQLEKAEDELNGPACKVKHAGLLEIFGELDSIIYAIADEDFDRLQENFLRFMTGSGAPSWEEYISEMQASGFHLLGDHYKARNIRRITGKEVEYHGKGTLKPSLY